MYFILLLTSTKEKKKVVATKMIKWNQVILPKFNIPDSTLILARLKMKINYDFNILTCLGNWKLCQSSLFRKFLVLSQSSVAFICIQPESISEKYCMEAHTLRFYLEYLNIKYFWCILIAKLQWGLPWRVCLQVPWHCSTLPLECHVSHLFAFFHGTYHLCTM